MLELQIIQNCAPTLAALKTGSLFSYRCSDESYLERELQEINAKLNEKGVYVKRLLKRDHYDLIYVYRLKHLLRDLEKKEIQVLLHHYGYTFSGVTPCIEHLMERLQECPCFPHEIGAFLGYPVEDVIGFIRHEGKDCKCCGFWKVYCNESQAQKTFEKLEKCFSIYSKVFAEGRNILQMTVAS